MVREGVRRNLELYPHFQVVGEAADGAEALKKVAQLEPEIILLDITMPGMNGFETAQQLCRQSSAKVIILTMHDKKEYVLKLIREGIQGYILKDTSSEELVQAILSVHNGHVYFSPPISRILLRQCTDSPGAQGAEGELSSREREVLAIIANGLSNKEAAQRLGLSVRTVETHRENIMRKLDIHNLAGLTKYALAHDLIELH